MPTPAQYLDSSFKKQILELVPVSISGTTSRFQVVYSGTPLPDANLTTGLGFSLYPLAFGLNINLADNYQSTYAKYYPFGEPSSSQDNSGIVILSGFPASLTGNFPNASSLPTPILEFSIPYSTGPISLATSGPSSGYIGVIEYSDDPRFPSLIASNASGATATNSIGATGDKFDYFSLVVPSGTSYDSLILAGLAGPGSANYTIYRSGSVDGSSSIVAAGQLGQTGVTTGQNLLTAGTTKTLALTAGLYTVKIDNQSSSEIAYQLDFSSYIPLPEFTRIEDTPFNIALPTTTSGNVAITWQASNLPAGVTLQISNGVYRLIGQTEANFNGVKLFNLTATENNTTAKQTSYSGLKLTIAPVNDAPTLTAIQPLSGGVEDTAKTITYAELAQAADEADVDVDDVLSFRIEAISSGTASLKKTTSSGFQDVQIGANGTLLSPGDSFQWTPAANANGLLNAFTVTAVDAALASSPPIQVAINTAAVNDAPTLTTISTLTGAQEDLFKEITFAELAAAANEADVDGDSLAFRIESLSTGTLQKWNSSSAVWESIQPGSTLFSASEKLQWKGSQDSNGELNAFTVKAWDGYLASSSVVQVKLNVAAVNDAPTLSTVNTLTGAVEDTFKEITFAELAAAANEADVDSTNLSFRIEALSSGTLQIQAAGSSAWAPALAGNLIASADKLRWQGAQDANGVLDAFTVKAWDGALASSSAVQVKVSVDAINDAPTLSTVNTLTGAVEDTFREITFSELAAAANEADVDNTNLSFRIEALSSGTLQIQAAGSSAWAPALAGNLIASADKLRWQGAQDANGVLDAFTVKAWDGALASSSAVQVKVSVDAINDAPTLTTISTLTGAQEDLFKEITYAELAAAANEADVDSTNLRFRIEALSSGTLQIQAAGSSAWAPALAGNLIASADKLRWQGAQDANGVLDAFTVKAWDGALASSSAVQVKVSVDAINDAPTLTTISTLTGATEDLFKEITYAELAAAANEADVDSTNLSFRIEALSSGTLQIQAAGSSAWAPALAGNLIASADKLRWQGAQDANGVLDAFTVKAWDGALASSSAVQVRVATAAVDDAPRLSPTKALSILENQPFSTTFDLVNVDPTDRVTLSLEGPDANAFAIDQAGQVSLKQPGNFESKSTYSVTVRATDTTPAQLSATTNLTLSILDQPDQTLLMSPRSLAFVPTVDQRISLTGSYTQDAPLAGQSAPQFFSAVLSYDGSSLDLAPSTLNQAGITLTNSDAGSTGPSSLTISTTNPALVSSFQLDFDVAAGATGPFNFAWTLSGASNYEQQTNSPFTISPDANAFIKNGGLDLSVFQTPLRIATEVKSVYLIDQPNVRLPYTQTINSIRATAFADQISVAQSLNIEAGAGDDTIDLRPLAASSQSVTVNARLGEGRDTLLLPAAPPAAQSLIGIEDFQLGFDRLQSAAGAVINRRSDVLAQAADPQSSLRQSAVNLRYAAIATDLDPGAKTLLSGQSPLVPSSIALDPGSNGRQLRLQLSSTAPTATARIQLPSQASLPSGFSWSLGANADSAILTLPTAFSLLTGLGDLRRAVSALVVDAPTPTQATLNLQWQDAQQGVLASVASAIQISPQVEIGGTTPLKLDVVAPALSTTPTQLQGSNAGDTIQLTSASTDRRTDKAFGGLGDDLLIAGDGDRLIGGDGSDTLIAYLGLGSTQLSGGAGNDRLIGGSNDALVGGEGDDTLVVRGLGNRLIGGSGSDLFILADAAFGPHNTSTVAANRILDFGKTDRLAFNLPGLQRSDLQIEDTAAGAVVRLSEPWSSRLGVVDLAVLQGVKKSFVSESQLLINQNTATLAPSILSRVDLIDQTA